MIHPTNEQILAYFFLIIVAIAESQKHRDYTEHSHANETWVGYQKIQNKP